VIPDLEDYFDFELVKLGAQTQLHTCSHCGMEIHTVRLNCLGVPHHLLMLPVIRLPTKTLFCGSLPLGMVFHYHLLLVETSALKSFNAKQTFHLYSRGFLNLNLLIFSRMAVTKYK
jgi:hypothetical protein